MRIRLFAAPILIVALAAPAYASMGGSPRPEPAPSQPEIKAGEEATPRQQAERLYGDAYEGIAKANAEATKGKDKNAQKKYKQALERASSAVELDPAYFEAWNLVGFAARKLGDYPRSLSAYGRCLSIQPGYAAAREYLGEAYVELGRIREAREQLAWLERLNAVPQMETLTGRIREWQSAHPDSMMPAPAARPDSAARVPSQGSGN